MPGVTVRAEGNGCSSGPRSVSQATLYLCPSSALPCTNPAPAHSFPGSLPLLEHCLTDPSNRHALPFPSPTHIPLLRFLPSV